MVSISSALAAPPSSSSVLGAQQPRIYCVPPSVSSAGDEAVDLCKQSGLILDPWEEFVLAHSLGEREDGSWSAFEVGLMVSRQNGKGAILEGRELAGLFLLDERLIIHSAHLFDTSLEAFRRLRELIIGNDELSRRVKRISQAHGEEGIELVTGQRIRFRTRTKGGGRGFTGDCLILDEAMELSQAAHGALLPTLSARPNTQVWYTGSAVDQQVHDHGLVFARVRARGHEGNDPRLAYFDWSNDCTIEDAHEIADDPAAWAQANPGLGIRISGEHIEAERRSMDLRTFAVERLGVGDWPATDGSADKRRIDVGKWQRLAEQDSQIDGAMCFAYDTRPDRSTSTIAVAGMRADGLPQVEIVDRKRGTGWLLERLAALEIRHEPVEIVCDGASPAASLVARAEKDFGMVIRPLGAREVAQACGAFYDAIEDAMLRHLGTDDMLAAIRGAATRDLGDAWAWSRKSSSVDISPLVAATLALWGLTSGSRNTVKPTFEVIL
jgi:hypothetical protein